MVEEIFEVEIHEFQTFSIITLSSYKLNSADYVPNNVGKSSNAAVSFNKEEKHSNPETKREAAHRTIYISQELPVALNKWLMATLTSVCLYLR